MFQRLLVIIVGLGLLTACAKPPVKELENTRRIVAFAYASGASQLAGEQYRAADSTLQEAEQLVAGGSYRKGRKTLERARKLAAQAVNLTVHRKKLWEEEQQRRLAEEKARLEAERLALEAERLALEAEKPKVKPPPPPPPPAPKPSPAPKLVDRVEVSDGETLASISARGTVYSDKLLWPLIYKANRDQIKDPQEIFSGQMLVIPRDKSEEEKESAREEARELNLFE